MIINSHSKHRKEEKLVAQDHKRKKWKTEIIFSVAANLSLDRYLLAFRSYIWIEQLLCSSSQCVSFFWRVTVASTTHTHFQKRQNHKNLHTLHTISMKLHGICIAFPMPIILKHQTGGKRRSNEHQVRIC